MVTMQNSKVKQLMSSFEKAEVNSKLVSNQDSEALLEAKQPAVRITTSKREDLVLHYGLSDEKNELADECHGSQV
jgi:hypothetical protein